MNKSKKHQTRSLERVKKNFAYFKQYLEGATYKMIAEQYGVSISMARLRVLCCLRESLGFMPEEDRANFWVVPAVCSENKTVMLEAAEKKVAAAIYWAEKGC